MQNIEPRTQSNADRNSGQIADLLPERVDLPEEQLHGEGVIAVDTPAVRRDDPLANDAPALVLLALGVSWAYQVARKPSASSAVGVYQMTDGTFAVARRYCVHDHAVVEDGPWYAWRSCWFNRLYARVVPGDAIELTSAYLDRSVAAVLDGRRRQATPLRLKQEVAAVLHLCGAGVAGEYMGRGFRLTEGQRCGTHDVRAYLARVARAVLLWSAAMATHIFTFRLRRQVEQQGARAGYVLIAALIGVGAGCEHLQTRPEILRENAQGPSCDGSLWAHVYHGRFSSAEGRLQVVNPCLTVSGVIVQARPEKDGDWHIQLDLDPEYRSLLNQTNLDKQQGYLVVEPICSRPVSQSDTIAEGVCNGFSQNIFTRDLIGKRVAAIGASVIDSQHGWMELHPVTSIVPLP